MFWKSSRASSTVIAGAWRAEGSTRCGFETACRKSQRLAQGLHSIVYCGNLILTVPAIIWRNTEISSWPPCTANNSRIEVKVASSGIGLTKLNIRRTICVTRSRLQVAFDPISLLHQYPSYAPSFQSHKRRFLFGHLTMHVEWVRARGIQVTEMDEGSVFFLVQRAVMVRLAEYDRKMLL